MPIGCTSAGRGDRGADTARAGVIDFTVLNTAFDAVNAGYGASVVSDCCSSADQNIHDVAVHTIEVIGASTTADQATHALGVRA